MTITLGWWLLPLALSGGVWAWSFRPRPYVGDWDFRGMFDIIIAIIATLAVWLAYFATLAVTRA